MTASDRWQAVTSPLRPKIRTALNSIGVVRIQRRLGSTVEPLSDCWGADRGLSIHRRYVEQFLEEHRDDVRGDCLEFSESRYTTMFGGGAVTKADVMHLDDTNPSATVVADITKVGDLPADAYDCIICTHVLHMVYELEDAVAGLWRLLKPGGVLHVAVPQSSMCDDRYGELWRFTTDGLGRVLASSFSSDKLELRAYGNSLVAAGELRGLVAGDFDERFLDQHDPRFAIELCARAVKGP